MNDTKPNEDMALQQIIFEEMVKSLNKTGLMITNLFRLDYLDSDDVCHFYKLSIRSCLEGSATRLVNIKLVNGCDVYTGNVDSVWYPLNTKKGTSLIT